jgi:hypothetical protein
MVPPEAALVADVSVGQEKTPGEKSTLLCMDFYISIKVSASVNDRCKLAPLRSSAQELRLLVDYGYWLRGDDRNNGQK